MIMSQPRKANILADALSRSKRLELNAVNSATTKGDQAEEILVMTQSSIVTTEEVNI